MFEDDKVFDEQVFPTSVSSKRATNKPALWRSLYDKVLHETTMGQEKIDGFRFSFGLPLMPNFNISG